MMDNVLETEVNLAGLKKTNLAAAIVSVGGFYQDVNVFEGVWPRLLYQSREEYWIVTKPSLDPADHIASIHPTHCPGIFRVKQPIDFPNGKNISQLPSAFYQHMKRITNTMKRLNLFSILKINKKPLVSSD